MKHHRATIVAIAFATALLTTACKQREKREKAPFGNGDVVMTFSNDIVNRFTPVKNQGQGGTCWIHAMLSTIETDRIMQGDSVNLSAAFVVRRMLEEQYRRHVLTAGASPVADRGTALDALRLIGAYGLVPFDSYTTSPDPCSPLPATGVLARKTRMIAEKAINGRMAPEKYERLLSSMLDESLGDLPLHVFMLGAEYTPQEFARSVCRSGDYVALTSFTHHPFGEYVDLELPDNVRHNLFYNIRMEKMTDMVRKAVKAGRGVCWEGDISEPGFSFRKGMATLPPGAGKPTQELRQKAFCSRATTDDHCMAIVGLAHDADGRRYFIMKNSWGKDNPYRGLMYMSEDYFMMKTIAVVIRQPGP